MPKSIKVSDKVNEQIEKLKEKYGCKSKSKAIKTHLEQFEIIQEELNSHQDVGSLVESLNLEIESLNSSLLSKDHIIETLEYKNDTLENKYNECRKVSKQRYENVMVMSTQIEEKTNEVFELTDINHSLNIDNLSLKKQITELETKLKEKPKLDTMSLIPQLLYAQSLILLGDKEGGSQILNTYAKKK